MSSWGNYCSYCGAVLPDIAFPRTCANGHPTYLYWQGVGVALQPVRLSDQIGLLILQRAIAPFVGRHALPGGYAEPAETLQAAAIRELHEETGISHHVADICRTFRQTVGDARAENDPRRPMLHFEIMPDIAIDVIDLNHASPETQSLGVATLDAPTSRLIDMIGHPVILCFPLHQAAAIDYLHTRQAYKAS